jgi:hypothetical protein
MGNMTIQIATGTARPPKLPGSCLVGVFITVLVVAAAAGSWPRPSWAAELKTGIEFSRALGRETGVDWHEHSLGIAVAELSKHLNVAILLDRRVDPQTPVDLTIQGTTAVQLLDRLATDHQLEIAVVESVIYIAPHGAGNVLGGRTNQLSKMKLPARWRRRTALRWPRLSEPRVRLQQLLSNQALHSSQLEQIPHDLWDAVHLPSMPLFLQVEIILAGFELQLVFDREGTATISPIRGTASTYIKSHSVPGSFVWNDSKIRDVVGQVISLTHAGRHAILQGTSWQHAKLDSLLRARRGTSKTHYTVPKTSGPLGQLVKEIARKLMLKVRYSDEVTDEARSEIVEFSVKEATRMELLDAILAGTSLRHRVVGDEWIIEPKGN